jgi:uncharacterized protein YceK
VKPLIVVFSLILSACATFEAADNVHQGSPRFFAGTRLDVAALTGNEAALDYFGEHGMAPPGYPGADLAPSIVADVALLPVAVAYTITEPLLYWLQDP